MNAPLSFLGGKVALHCGDCLDVIKTLADDSIDAVVTDPPYALVSIGKRCGAHDAAPCKPGKTGASARASAGFMGKKWDTGKTAFAVEFWAEVLRVLKPGGHVAAFGGTRSFHRLACAIEDAGFEIRDQLAWTYGSGFPKSHDVSKGIDKAAGAEREVLSTEKVRDIRNGHGRAQGEGIHASGRDGPTYMERAITAAATADAREWQGWGTALKPAWEPICLARKPLSEKTTAANILRWGTGAINVDACRIEGGGSVKPRGSSKLDTEMNEGWARPWMEDRAEVQARHDAAIDRANALGRWPANIVHDGSGEVLAAFPEAPGAFASVGPQYGDKDSVNAYGDWGPRQAMQPRADAGSAAHFFYSAKADADDRLGSKHPTVKPVDLMQWLCKLITPPAGVILDPFAGTGTTGAAAWREGFRAVLIEREAEYQADIARRMKLELAGPDERSRGSIKARGRTADAGPLFGGLSEVAGGADRFTASSRTRNRADRDEEIV